VIRSALGYALADKVGSALVTVATMAIISRILTPGEVGLFFVSGAIRRLLRGPRGRIRSAGTS